MTPAEVASHRALLEATEKFAETLRAELEVEGVQPDGVRPSDLLTVGGAAFGYKVREETARRWARKWGKKIGGRWYIRPDAIERRRP